MKKEALAITARSGLRSIRTANDVEGSETPEPTAAPDRANPTPVAAPVVLSLVEELAELGKIETHIRFLKLTRPKTDEYLEQKQEEVERRRRLRRVIVSNVAQSFELNKEGVKDEIEMRKRLVLVIDQLIAEVSGTLKDALTAREKKLLTQDVIDEVLGLGPMEQLVRDDDISEIMVNGPNQIIVEKKGRLITTPITFDGEEHLRRIIDRIVSPIGRRIDESSPIVDARLADGSRVNALIPPVALDGSSLTIRKFRKEALGVADLISFGALSDDMACFLRACVEGHRNIVISGGTGSGKTTLLNTLASFIPPGERIVTIEDAAELQVKRHHEHVVRLESRPANIEGKGSIAIRDLVKNALRMRPDRIVVGECRGGEALDMLQAMNTGHDGSMTTGHANTPQDMIRRLETMVKMSGVDLPISAIREQISSAVHVIVQANRLSDGSRKVTCIAEVCGMEDDKVALRDIFLFRQSGVSKDGAVLGEHGATGVTPRFLDLFRSEGIELDEKIFVPRTSAETEAFQIERYYDGPICFLRIGGAIDQSTAQKLETFFLEQALLGPVTTCLSLDRVERLDAEGIRLLSTVKQFFRDNERNLLIRDVPDSIAATLRNSGEYDRLVLDL